MTMHVACAADDVTGMLVQWRHGDRAALDAMIPAVYRELRRLARNRLRAESRVPSLQVTGLVHEVYLRLLELDRLTLENRSHFLAMAARLMRRIVVDHARRRDADKRGAGVGMLALDDVSPAVDPASIDLLALDRALEELAAVNERLSRVVELKFFAGLTIEETAVALEVSRATVERDWTLARAWLFARLTTGNVQLQS